MVELTNNHGFSTWRRSLAERLRRPKGEETAARIEVVEGLLRELGERREALQSAIAAAGEEELALADRGGDYSDVSKVRARRSRSEWDLRQLAAAEAPLLEELASLRSRARQERLEAFQSEQREALERGIGALEAAFAAFDEARDTWARAASAGFEREMLGVVDIWTKDSLARLKSQLAGEPFPKLVPQPVVTVPISERQPLPHEAVGHGAATYTPGPPVRPPARALRRDGPPKEGERQIVLLRAGAELGDGTTALAGDVVNVPAAQAVELVRHSAADYTAVAGG
jgi:hypothetical protein